MSTCFIINGSVLYRIISVLSLNLQKIDGFLAVLSITGGNFSPKSQKLPFTVTSVDGDSYLLYYASIDLPGKSRSNKCRGETFKSILGHDDSQRGKNRLRIPMKGRIQLVFSLFLHPLGCMAYCSALWLFLKVTVGIPSFILSCLDFFQHLDSKFVYFP